MSGSARRSGQETFTNKPLATKRVTFANEEEL